MNMFKTTLATTPEEYIAGIGDDARRKDIQTLHDMIVRAVPQFKPHIMSGMLAYGKYRYKYASGREGEWMPVALASQKNYISLYICAVTPDGRYIADGYRDTLPKADIGKSCVRFKRLSDVDLRVLTDLVKEAATLPSIGQTEVI